MEIFETHAHLNLSHYDKDREQIIQECFNSDIKYIINVGFDQESSEAGIKLSEKYKEIYASVGYHPHDSDSVSIDVVRKLAKHRKVVAIGEIGLDYYRNLQPKNVQKKAFAEQIELAIELNKPIIIHDREAHEDCLSILEKFNPQKVVFHSFSGDEIFAEKILSKGWMISITGVVTYKNSNLPNVIRMLPKDQFFIETDSPYLPPVPFRGKRNSPAYLKYVIEKIAEIKQVPPKLIAKESFENAKKFFSIK